MNIKYHYSNLYSVNGRYIIFAFHCYYSIFQLTPKPEYFYDSKQNLLNS